MQRKCKSGFRVMKTGKYSLIEESHTKECKIKPLEEEKLRTLIEGETFPYMFMCGHSVEWELL